MISVIIPVYNVESYLRRCVDSVRQQTYKDLEVILVDDGSTDGSGKLCEVLAGEDERIKVIHKENGGASSARNTGIDNAKGEYIGFVDSDDKISLEMYRYLLELLEKNGADMALADITGDEADIHENKKESDKIEIFSGKDVYKLISDYKTKGISPCNKLYKRELFEGIRFKIGVHHEDTLIMPYLVERCSKVVESDRKLYCYILREESTSGVEKKSTKHMWDLLDALKDTCLFFKERDLLDEQKHEARLLCNHIINYYKDADKNFENSIQVRRNLREYFNEALKINDNVFSIKQLTYFLFRINPRLGILFREIISENRLHNMKSQ